MADRECPDCKGKLTGIKLIGTGWENPLTGIAVQTELRIFSEAEAQRGSFSGVFPAAGKVESLMCTECGRIFLYGSAVTSKIKNGE
jgi:uncharacterized protein YbaR (Trm112 family)